MDASDLLALPLKLGSAIRRRRVFHPVGVMARGSLERLAPPGEGLPVESSDVVARVSKGVGLPGALPDIAGLAVRIPPRPFAATPWDLLLASAVARVVLLPVTSWSDVSLSSLMPLRHQDGYWWVGARLVTEIDDAGLSLDSIRRQISHGGVQFDLQQACGRAPFQPLARLSLSELAVGDASHDVAFDPSIHSAPDVRLAPEWLTDLRRRAYQRSREGRAAD
ncbi:MAG: phosphodiesterase [Mycobacteriaceae bacterium]|nr:phosphodiesterase [Mycobacteriaceae bacterium]MBV9638638.1 phosphodiesterase [Mycobacteriaceae bacterium]